MDKKILLFSLILCISPTIVNAQKIGLDVQVSANYPVIPTYYKQVYSVKWSPVANVSGVIVVDQSTKIREKYQDNIGGKIGLNASLDLKKNFFISTGIGLNFISFKREFQYVDLAEPIPGGFSNTTIPSPGIFSSDIGKTFLLYTDIPVSAGVKLIKKQLSLNLGLTVSLLTFSQQYLVKQYNEFDVRYEKIVLDNTSEGLTKVSFSVHAEAAYRVKLKYSVFVRYSRQLSPIYKKDYQYVGKAKYNLIELGAGYRL